MQLSEKQRIEYLENHIPYRLNSMMAWDLYISKRSATEFDKENPENKCYWVSEILEPALEISIIFTRSLLHFLGIGLLNGKLGYFVSNRNDDVQIWDVVPGKNPYPLSNLNEEQKINLENIIKMANKSTAHLTTNFASEEEHYSMEPARKLVFGMVLQYVDGLRKDRLWWQE